MNNLDSLQSMSIGVAGRRDGARGKLLPLLFARPIPFPDVWRMARSETGRIWALVESPGRHRGR